MTKYSLLLLASLAFVTGCGQESTIKNSIEAENLRAPRKFNLVLPLTEDMIATFDTPIKEITPVLRGVVTPLLHLGAMAGAGKTKISMDQPIPEIPTNRVKGLKVSRLFFYLEPTQADLTAEEKREAKEVEKRQKKAESDEKKAEKSKVGRILHDVGSALGIAKDAVVDVSEKTWEGVMKVTGQRPEMTFDFLNELAVTLSSTKSNEAVKDWMPKVNVGSFTNEDTKILAKALNKKKAQELKLEQTDKEVLVKFKGSKSKSFTRADEFGQVYIIETNTPGDTRKAIENDPLLYSYTSRIHTLNKSLLIELVNDPVVEENFKYVFNQKLADSVRDIRPCNEKTCIDLQTSDTNLIPLVTQGNGIRMDILLNVGSVPPSFQIKGFVEFEVIVIPLPQE